MVTYYIEFITKILAVFHTLIYILNQHFNLVSYICAVIQKVCKISCVTHFPEEGHKSD